MRISKRGFLTAGISGPAIIAGLVSEASAAPAAADTTSILVKSPKDGRVLTHLVASAALVGAGDPIAKMSDEEERHIIDLVDVTIRRLAALSEFIGPAMMGQLIDQARKSLSHLTNIGENRKLTRKAIGESFEAGEVQRMDVSLADAELYDTMRAVEVSKSELAELEFKYSLYGKVKERLEQHVESEQQLRKKLLERTTIRAPMAGTVSFLVDEANYVKKGNPIAEINLQ